MWIFQTPETTSSKMRSLIGVEAGKATRGGAAFAFVTAAGAKMLEAEAGFKALLAAGEFDMVVGLDAITDTTALEALQSIAATHANFKPLAFLHSKVGSLFHPKTLWLKNPNGGVIIAGSGNLTPGGLNSNWEAASLLRLSDEEFQDYEKSWQAWIENHKDCLFKLDDPKVIEQAKRNKIQKAKVRKALVLAEESEAIDEVVGSPDGALIDLGDPTVLIAEVPKSKDRWKQVNFDIATYQNFFGVTLGAGKDVEFRHIKNDGTLDEPEHRHAVAVKSRNFRFEIGAAAKLPYPAAGHPIVIFQRVTEQLFFYILLMPGEGDHALIQKYLEDNYVQSRSKRRVIMPLSTFKGVWPNSPFFV